VIFNGPKRLTHLQGDFSKFSEARPTSNWSSGEAPASKRTDCMLSAVQQGVPGKMANYSVYSIKKHRVGDEINGRQKRAEGRVENSPKAKVTPRFASAK
jgi:hypothetical protein